MGEKSSSRDHDPATCFALDGRVIFDALEAAMVEGFDTIALIAGKELWIGDSMFDVARLVAALSSAKQVAGTDPGMPSLPPPPTETR